MSNNNNMNDLLMEIKHHMQNGNKDVFDVLLKMAENGYAEAQFEAGYAYGTGLCVKADYKLAAEWYGRAAAQNVLNAQFNLGSLHLQGRGFRRSAKNALHWFKMAADNGHERAKQILPGIQMEVEATHEEHILWRVAGTNKAPGIVNLKFAHRFLAELKEILTDPEVSRGVASAAINGRIGLGKSDKIEQAMTLMYNLSSATPLSIETVTQCVITDDWGVFETMPES
jgi:TPR repeat protein